MIVLLVRYNVLQLWASDFDRRRRFENLTSAKWQNVSEQARLCMVSTLGKFEKTKPFHDDVTREIGTPRYIAWKRVYFYGGRVSATKTPTIFFLNFYIRKYLNYLWLYVCCCCLSSIMLCYRLHRRPMWVAPNQMEFFDKSAPTSGKLKTCERMSS